MNRKDRISLAADYLSRRGYTVEATPNRGIDLLARDKGGITAFVAVSPLRTRHFPLRPFKGSKTRLRRFHSLTAGINKWIVKNPYKGIIRLDSVYVADDGRLDHTYGNTHRIGAY